MRKIEDLFQCKVCKLKYKDKRLAEKCQEWCSRNKSCNLEITKYAINKNKENE